MSKDLLNQRLLAVFQSELAEHRQTLEQELLQLEQADTEEKRSALLESLFRAAHSLKGAARSVRLTGIERHCHRLEHHFHELRTRTRVLDKSLLEQLFSELDALGKEADTLSAAQAPREPAASAEPHVKASVQTREPVLEQSFRVAAEKVDGLLAETSGLTTLTSMLEISLTELSDIREQLTALSQRDELQGVRGQFRELHKTLEQTEERFRRQVGLVMRASERLEDDAQRLRLMPFREATQGLERAVRDLGQMLEKPVELVIEDNGVEVDRAIAQRLRDPMLHLLRNAIGHGIEPQELRTVRGKPRLSTIIVRATLVGKQVEISIRDDGGGFDLNRVRARAQAMQLDADVSDAELLRYAFLPGFSTAQSVTELSGRGVGLDVVKRSVEEMHGTVELSSWPGRGSQFSLRLPLTLSKLRCLFVQAGGRCYAIPALHVQRILRFEDELLVSVEGREMLRVQDALVPLASLCELLGHAPAKAREALRTALLVESSGKRVAIVVEGLAGEREVTARALPKRVAQVKNVTAATYLELGRIALVLNPHDLSRRALERPAHRVQLRREEARRHRVLVADDSATTRAVLKSVLEQAQYVVATAIDGQDALEQLLSGSFDALVSDVQMPRRDGLSLAEAVRSHPKLKSLPVILVTSLDNESDRLRGLRAGASAYLTKGAFDHRTLLETLLTLL